MKSEKILIIDDCEPDYVRIINLLRESGYENIFAAETAEAGINIAKTEKPAMVLLDIRLPGLDGIRTCAILKNRYNVQSVIMVTGLDDPASRDLSKTYGADDYIVKPVTIGELNNKIDAAFKRRPK